MKTPMEQQAFELHEALMAWLRMMAHRPGGAPAPLVVITACTYEIGRLVGMLAGDMTPGEIDGMLDGITSVMREHIALGRQGFNR